ncbi:hypothetical protein ACFOKI_15070 [Sphingomonas qilianensis]|uniref:hypothetical protein n=1 Tax=Sphingomonas qilianensis TaxID=1736690 RepID=UPI003616F0D0
MNTALNLMVDEGDTLLIAAIAHPMQIVSDRISYEDDTVRETTVYAAGGCPGSISIR